jgi:hypothetical protein
MKYRMCEVLDIQVNGVKSKAKIFGYEPVDDKWLYHIRIDEYPFDIKVLEESLVRGINIVTNGSAIKVLVNEEIKAK